MRKLTLYLTVAMAFTVAQSLVSCNEHRVNRDSLTTNEDHSKAQNLPVAESQTVTESQVGAQIQEAKVPKKDFSNRKPFKYTIDSNVYHHYPVDISVVSPVNCERYDKGTEANILKQLGMYQGDNHIEILISINDVNGQYPVLYDLDCDGDGIYEYIGLTSSAKCKYKDYSGKHQIWIRGDIPGLWLCATPKIPERYLYYPILNIFQEEDDEEYDEPRGCTVVNNDAQVCPEPYGYFPFTPHTRDYHSDCTDNGVDDFRCYALTGFVHDGFQSVISIDDWGDIEWKTMFAFSADCQKLSQIPDEMPNLNDVTDISHFFDHAELFNLPVEHWDVSKITNMAGMFKDAKQFDQPLDKWDVSNVNDMSGMFYGAESFDQPLKSWNVSNVKDMHQMFKNAESFDQPLKSWNVSNVRDMTQMFKNAESFDQPLKSWNVSNVRGMSNMFAGAISFNQPLGQWNVSNVRDMSGMFKKTESFNQPLGQWNVSNVRNMGYMFAEAILFNQPLDKWNVSNVKNMSRMFYQAKSFNHYPARWIVPKGSYGMFNGTKVEQIADPPR